MPTRTTINHRIQTTIFLTFFVTNLALSIFLVSRSFLAQHRDIQTQGYIRCIVLLRYDYPTLNEKSPKADVEAALDNCATVK